MSHINRRIWKKKSFKKSVTFGFSIILILIDIFQPCPLINNTCINISRLLL